MARFTKEHRELSRAAQAERGDPEALVDGARLDLNERTRGMVIARVGEMPIRCRKTYVRAMRGKAPMTAIKAFC